MGNVKVSSKVKSRDRYLDYVLVVLFILIIIVTLYPFLNVLAISLNDPVDTMRNINFVLPRKFTLYNYQYVFRENDLFGAFAISVARTVIGTGAGVICTSMVAYVPVS